MFSNPWLPDMEWQEIYQRSLAAYTGFAIGDALGATTEFMRPREIQAEHGIHKEIRGGGWLHLKPGKVTDDTEMSLALGDALIEAGKMDETVVAEHFLKWMRTKPMDIGHTNRQGLSRYKIFGTVQADYSDYATSNGALMRNLPVIIATLKSPQQLKDWSVRQAMITHNNEEAFAGMLLISELTRQVIIQSQAAPLKTIVTSWIANHPDFDCSRYKRSIDGHIADTVKTILYYFFHTGDFESCLVGIVNAGGDTDTNAALAGMLAAAFYGMTSIPRRWLVKMDQGILRQIHHQTRQLFSKFNHPGSYS